MTRVSKELYVIQETMAQTINNDIKLFAITWFSSIDVVEAGRFRFSREVESVRERSELLKRSGRRTVEEHKNRSRRERRRDPIVAWRYSPFWWKLVHVGFTRKVHSGVLPETVLFIEHNSTNSFKIFFILHWSSYFCYFTIHHVKLKNLTQYLSLLLYIETYLSFRIEIMLCSSVFI